MISKDVSVKKIAIVGASYLQEPLIDCAKARGYETHVFAWETGDVGEKSADYFYPISVREKERILEKCIEIGIDGICSIASDIANITVNYVAHKMSLTGNSPSSVKMSSNKYYMRKRFYERGDPSPRYRIVHSIEDGYENTLDYPIIVKPVDRSGSRGITRVNEAAGLKSAIESAFSVGFEKSVMIEEYVSGHEYSVECISWDGRHTFLSLTQKYTTGFPHYIETGHLEPAIVTDQMLERIKAVVFHALDSLEIRYGASHSEIKITENEEIKIIEIGARMGGDNIGSALVQLTTGYPFVDAVLDVSLGIEPKYKKTRNRCAGIRFVISNDDIEVLNRIRCEHPDLLVMESIGVIKDDTIKDSSSRFGYYIIVSDDESIIQEYMPNETDNML